MSMIRLIRVLPVRGGSRGGGGGGGRTQYQGWRNMDKSDWEKSSVATMKANERRRKRFESALNPTQVSSDVFKGNFTRRMPLRSRHIPHYFKESVALIRQRANGDGEPLSVGEVDTVASMLVQRGATENEVESFIKDALAVLPLIQSPSTITKVVRSMVYSDRYKEWPIAAFAKHAEPLLYSFSPKDLADFIFDLSMLGGMNSRLLRVFSIFLLRPGQFPSPHSAVVPIGIRRLDWMNAEMLAQVLNPYMFKRDPHLKLLDEAAKHAINLLPISPPSLTRLAVSLGPHHFPQELILDAMNKLDTFSISDLSLMLWNLSEKPPKELFTVAAHVVLPKIPDMEPYDTTRLVTAFARAGLRSNALFLNVAADAVSHSRVGREWDAQALCAIPRAFAMVGIIDDEFNECIAKTCKSRLKSLTNKQFVDVVRAVPQVAALPSFALHVSNIHTSPSESVAVLLSMIRAKNPEVPSSILVKRFARRVQGLQHFRVLVEAVECLNNCTCEPGSIFDLARNNLIRGIENRLYGETAPEPQDVARLIRILPSSAKLVAKWVHCLPTLPPVPILEALADSRVGVAFADSFHLALEDVSSDEEYVALARLGLLRGNEANTMEPVSNLDMSLNSYWSHVMSQFIVDLPSVNAELLKDGVNAERFVQAFFASGRGSGKNVSDDNVDLIKLAMETAGSIPSSIAPSGTPEAAIIESIASTLKSSGIPFATRRRVGGGVMEAGIVTSVNEGNSMVVFDIDQRNYWNVPPNGAEKYTLMPAARIKHTALAMLDIIVISVPVDLWNERTMNSHPDCVKKVVTDQLASCERIANARRKRKLEQEKELQDS